MCIICWEPYGNFFYEAVVTYFSNRFKSESLLFD